MIKFNINNWVKVKLTELGKEIEKKNYEALNEMLKQYGSKYSDEFKLEVDENGYTSYQLWELFEKFGSHVGIGKKQPFETEIILIEHRMFTEEQAYGNDCPSGKCDV
ncbi:hypothetical protein ACFQ3W_23420 [Paenibacillus puldeungensis]|uniref:Uncharacterized protein n=1 Tax=Paenibacillus puldeungensis TaxID=696536 RepID=A0ABW3S3Z8_9BACL